LWGELKPLVLERGGGAKREAVDDDKLIVQDSDAVTIKRQEESDRRGKSLDSQKLFKSNMGWREDWIIHKIS